jgi:hypothetical protein
MTFQLPPHNPSTIPGLPDTGTLWVMLQHHATRVLGPDNPLNNLTTLASGGLDGGGLGLGSLPSLPSLPAMSSLPSRLSLPLLPSLPDFSINTALTAVQGHFQGFNTEGYLDFSKGLGLDYSFHVATDGTLSGDIEAEATLPLLTGFKSNSGSNSTIIPRLTVGHQVRMCHRHPDSTALHSLKISMPVAKGRGSAKLRVKQSPEGGNRGLSLEIGGKSKHLQKQLGIFNNNSGKNNNRDDEEENVETATSIDNGIENSNNTIVTIDGNDAANNNFQTMTVTTMTENNKFNKKPVICRLPHLKLDIDPLIPTNKLASPFSRTVSRHIGFHWHQTWSSTIRTAAVYRSRSRKIQVDARAKILPTMLVTAGAVVDSRDKTVHQAVAKVLWKPCCRINGTNSNGRGDEFENGGGGAQHAVQLESKYSKESGVHHVVKVRRRPKREDGMEASVSVNLTQENITRPAVQFDVYLPL